MLKYERRKIDFLTITLSNYKAFFSFPEELGKYAVQRYSEGGCNYLAKNYWYLNIKQLPSECYFEVDRFNMIHILRLNKF